MEVKIDNKDWRIVRDELGNELFRFTGDHLDDLRYIVKTLNKVKYEWYSKRSVTI